MTVPKRLSFPAQLSNCNLATCWHIELSILGLLHLSISTHLSNTFSCSMKFFLGLAWGESCVACATTEKHGCPVSTFSYFHGKAFLGKPATITLSLRRKQGCELMDQIQTVVWQFFCASLGRSLCHGNEHHGIDPNMSNSGHHDCSTQAVFLCTADKLQCWPMLAHWTQHIGPSHTAFIGAKASVVLSSSFIWK